MRVKQSAFYEALHAGKLRARLEEQLEEAERKAWDSLARYKFQMFGYWAAIWVHLNRLEGLKRPNPWSKLVKEARVHHAVKGHEGG